MSRTAWFFLIVFSLVWQPFFPPFVSGADNASAVPSRAFSPAPSIPPDDPRLAGVAAEVQSGNLGKALKQLQALNQQFPDDPTIAYFFGSLFQVGGQYANAISWYDRSIRRDADNAAAFYKRGAARLALHDPRQAALDFFKAWLSEPGLTEAVTDIGMVFLFHGAADEAVKYLHQGVKWNPASARAWYGLGRALGATGKIREAVPAFDRAIALAPQVSAFEVDRAWAAFLLDPVENREYFVKVIKRVLAANTYHRRAMEVAAALYDLEHPSPKQGGVK